MISLKILTELGMSEKESRIYLACLELGASPVTQISREAGITRGSTYDLLEIMLDKGYVSKIHQDKHMIFSATNPEILKKRHQEALRHFEEVMPELQGLFNKHDKPKVRYFEGLDGIKRVYEDTLTASTEILNYANSREIRSRWPEYDQEYVAKRIEKNILLKGLAPDDEWGKKVKKEDKTSLRKTRLIPKKNYTFANEINIYDHKVAITSFGDELIGIIIESRQIANTQRDIFKMVWRFAHLRS